jgi:8-oxo-dGTP diphosphatase
MAHINEKIDFVVEAFIIHKDRVLMVNHISAGMWLPVGGHIELDEDPEAALFREIEEESGLSKKNLKIISKKPKLNYKAIKFLYSPAFLDIHDIKSGHKHIAFVYFFKSKIDKVTLKDDEHHEIRWFTRKDLRSGKFEIRPWIIYYANEAFKLAGN